LAHAILSPAPLEETPRKSFCVLQFEPPVQILKVRGLCSMGAAQGRSRAQGPDNYGAYPNQPYQGKPYGGQQYGSQQYGDQQYGSQANGGRYGNAGYQQHSNQNVPRPNPYDQYASGNSPHLQEPMKNDQWQSPNPDLNAYPGYDDAPVDRRKYDTHILSVAREETWYEYMFGAGPRHAKSPAVIRDERYASYIVSLDKLFRDWETNDLPPHDVLQIADAYLQMIRETREVDSERARMLLARNGLDDHRRLDLQRLYQDLRRQCSMVAGKEQTQTTAQQGRVQSPDYDPFAPGSNPDLIKTKRKGNFPC